MAAEKRGATSAGVHEDICHICYVMFESLEMITSDSLLSRARAREDFLELWRKLHAETKVIAAKCQVYQERFTTLSVNATAVALPSREQLESEVLTGGYVVPE